MPSTTIGNSDQLNRHFFFRDTNRHVAEIVVEKSQFCLNHELQDLLNNVFRIFARCMMINDIYTTPSTFTIARRWRRRSAGLPI
jgi:hypothetical protein